MFFRTKKNNVNTFIRNCFHEKQQKRGYTGMGV